MKTENNPTRQHIINIGYQLISTKGFTGVGLTEILKTAAVPKGSFYHYFKSKEEFGEVIIKDYFSQYLTSLETVLTPNTEQTAFDQLMASWQLWLTCDVDNRQQKRCLVVKLSAEVADLSERMRIALHNGSNKIIALIAQCIKNGIADNSICPQDENETATMLYSMWLGASLLSKLHRDEAILIQTLKQTERLLMPI